MDEPRPKKLSSGLESFARPARKQAQGIFTFVTQEAVQGREA
jgi:hypothetical protein